MTAPCGMAGGGLASGGALSWALRVRQGYLGCRLVLGPGMDRRLPEAWPPPRPPGALQCQAVCGQGLPRASSVPVITDTDP